MIGIYKLFYDQDTRVYIGQSINIDQRYRSHKYLLKKNQHKNKNLQELYNKYGIPKLEVIDICSKEELDNKEKYFMDKFNSAEIGLNIMPAGMPYPVKNGEENANSKYDNDTIISIFLYLINNKDRSLKDISKELGIHYSTVKNINNGSGHRWLKEVFPQEYIELINNKGNREINISKIDYPNLKNPKGEVVFVGKNLTKFCRDNDLSTASIRSIFKNIQQIHKGWTLAK